MEQRVFPFGSKSLLALLARKERETFLKAVLDNGIDCLYAGGTALMIACRAGDVTCVHSLLGQGANVNLQHTKHRNTALHYACLAGNVECATLLLKAGADPNLFNKHKCTPLMSACECGNESLVEALLQAGSEVTFQSELRHSAADYAQIHSHFALSAMLRSIELQTRSEQKAVHFPVPVNPSAPNTHAGPSPDQAVPGQAAECVPLQPSISSDPNALLSNSFAGTQPPRSVPIARAPSSALPEGGAAAVLASVAIASSDAKAFGRSASPNPSISPVPPSQPQPQPQPVSCAHDNGRPTCCVLCGEALRRRMYADYLQEKVLHTPDPSDHVNSFAHSSALAAMLAHPQGLYHRLLETRTLRKEASESWAVVAQLQALVAAEAARDPHAPIVIFDLCCGKSLTAALCGHIFPQATIVAMDKRPAKFLPHFDALPNVCFVQADLFHSAALLEAFLQPRTLTDTQGFAAHAASLVSQGLEGTGRRGRQRRNRVRVRGPHGGAAAASISPASETAALPTATSETPALITTPTAPQAPLGAPTGTPLSESPAQGAIPAQATPQPPSHPSNTRRPGAPVGIMVGMHLCGLLSEHAISLFNSIEGLRHLVLSPCCLPAALRSPVVGRANRLRTDQYAYWCLHLLHSVRARRNLLRDPGILSLKNALITASKDPSPRE